jgi:putative methyltransferase (TIGR04325 family)
MINALRLLWRTCKPRWFSDWQTKHNTLSFKGPYPSWPEAASSSRGYDDEYILKLTIQAARKVAAGKAAYDRDTITFKSPQPDTMLLSALARAANNNSPRLRVLDFGGSLGSSYRQNRPYIKQPQSIDWHIVEQPSVAEAGIQEFSTEELRFHFTLEQALNEGAPDFLLLSSVLQYLEQAQTLLDRLTQLPVQGALIARTPFWDGDEDLIVTQIVPPRIYSGSYPMWIFSRKKMRERWESAGMCVETRPAHEGGFSISGINFEFDTWLLQRNPLINIP